MGMNDVLVEVDSWPVEERLQLLGELWDRLVDHGEEPGLSEAQKTELDRRLAEDDASPDDVVAWDDVLAEALARARR